MVGTPFSFSGLALPLTVPPGASSAFTVAFTPDDGSEPIVHDVVKIPEGGGDAHLPVPVNHMMVATFFLAGMDVSFRIGRWLRAIDLDWERAMVVIAGRQGRATAGVTWTTSSIATMTTP